MANFNYMTNLVEFGFKESFIGGLSKLGKKGKSIVNDVRGGIKSNGMSQRKVIDTPKPVKGKAIAGAPDDYNLTNKTSVIPGGAGSTKSRTTSSLSDKNMTYKKRPM